VPHHFIAIKSGAPGYPPNLQGDYIYIYYIHMNMARHAKCLRFAMFRADWTSIFVPRLVGVDI